MKSSLSIQQINQLHHLAAHTAKVTNLSFDNWMALAVWVYNQPKGYSFNGLDKPGILAAIQVLIVNSYRMSDEGYVNYLDEMSRDRKTNP